MQTVPSEKQIPPPKILFHLKNRFLPIKCAVFDRHLPDMGSWVQDSQAQVCLTGYRLILRYKLLLQKRPLYVQNWSTIIFLNRFDWRLWNRYVKNRALQSASIGYWKRRCGRNMINGDWVGPVLLRNNGWFDLPAMLQASVKLSILSCFKEFP